MLQSPFTRKGNFPSSRPLPRKEGKKTYVKEKKLMTYWISDICTNQAIIYAMLGTLMNLPAYYLIFPGVYLHLIHINVR